MKRMLAALLAGLGVYFVGWSQTAGVQAAVPLVFATTFPSSVCPEGQRINGANDSGVCATGDGLAGWGGGLPDEITSAANYSGGGGGRGFRHWRGDGQNNNGGGVRVDFGLTTPPLGLQKEFWVRWYMRYEAGFAWLNGHPGYTKEIYVNVTQQGAFTWGFHGSANFGIDANGNGAPPGWTNIMTPDGSGGAVGDGLWHCYEGHVKAETSGSNGIGQSWIDGVPTDNSNSVSYGTTSGWGLLLFGSNQASPANGRNMYTDYDDIAISTVGRIGCLSGGGSAPPAAPTNLRIIR